MNLLFANVCKSELKQSKDFETKQTTIIVDFLHIYYIIFITNDNFNKYYQKYVEI